MAINKWVDSGEIYIVGEYQIGTSIPTGQYKIGMVQNDSTSVDRLSDHQTGNPNKLFLAAVVPVEATYLVEQLMHIRWDANRISLEWFRFTTADITQAVTDINTLDAQHGPSVVQLRNVYFAAPTSGSNPSLTPALLLQAEQLRDDAYDLCKDMAQLKFTSETLKLQILTQNGLNASVDCVTTVKVKASYSEFSESLLPAALKATYMTKTRKRKDDFRFLFTQAPAQICNISLASAHWRSLFSAEETAHGNARSLWTSMEPTITPSTVNANVQLRSAGIEALHDAYTSQLRQYRALDEQLKVIEVNLKVMCYDYEEIPNVCRWRRVAQSNSFNKEEFKRLDFAAFTDSSNQAPKGNTAKPTVVKFKAW